MAKEGKNLIDFIHAQSGLSLLKLTNKAQANPGLLCQLWLGYTERLSSGLDKKSKGRFHTLLIHPYGYKRKDLCMFYTL